MNAEKWAKYCLENFSYLIAPESGDYEQLNMARALLVAIETLKRIDAEWGNLPAREALAKIRGESK